MNQQRRRVPDHHRAKHTALPPIIQEDDLEFPFLKQDFFSDVAISVGVNASATLTKLMNMDVL